MLPAQETSINDHSSMFTCRFGSQHSHLTTATICYNALALAQEQIQQDAFVLAAK